MLNGIDPIILFNFFKLSEAQTENLSRQVPIVADITNLIGLPPIPVYLSEKLTGLFIDSEDKNVDVETTTETLANGQSPITYQRGINSSVKIKIKANKDSIGVALISAMADFIFEKVTSREYSITYLHGAVTVFNGLLHSFSVNQVSDTNLLDIEMELMRTGASTKKANPIVEVPRETGAVPIS